MAKGMAELPEDDGRRPASPSTRTCNAELKGEGPMAGMMGRMFKLDTGHVVTKIETGDVDADAVRRARPATR